MVQILVVDDDPQILKLLDRTLTKEGCETRLASDGKEALNCFNEKRPDLVVTDIVMPEKEGIEVIIELKTKAPDVKIIAISGGGKVNPNSYLSIANTLGAQATLVKPIDIEEFLSTVASVLKG